MKVSLKCVLFVDQISSHFFVSMSFCVLNWPITQYLMVNSKINYVNWSGRGAIGSCWEFQVNIFSSHLLLPFSVNVDITNGWGFRRVSSGQAKDFPFRWSPRIEVFWFVFAKNYHKLVMQPSKIPGNKIYIIYEMVAFETFGCLCFYSLFILISSD